jgi:hypothetical protein
MRAERSERSICVATVGEVSGFGERGEHARGEGGMAVAGEMGKGIVRGCRSGYELGLESV